MTSTPEQTADSFDLERDLPLTAADIAALDRAREIPPLDFEKYLEWLSLMTANGSKRPHTTFPDAPFEL